MCDADGRFRFIDVLPAGTGGTIGVDLQFLGIDLQLHVLCFRQNSDRCSAGVDPSAGFCFRYPLDPVDARLKFQSGKRAFALNEDAALLHTAKLGFIQADGLHFPPAALGVHRIHP